MPTSPAKTASYRAVPNVRARSCDGEPSARTPLRVRPSLRMTFSRPSDENGKVMVADASPFGELITCTV